MKGKWIWLMILGALLLNLSLWADELNPMVPVPWKQSFNLNDVVGVTGTDDLGLRVRDGAGLSAKVLKVVPDLSLIHI